MNRTQIFMLWLTIIIAVIVPTPLFAQSSDSCDCATDTLNCSDFASLADAQMCFWYCGAQGAGDIHRLDADMNTIACDVLAEPIVVPTLETNYVEPIYAEPMPALAMPTAVPVYEVCSCGGDYYDCNTFSSPSHAQGCYDYCANQGLGDIHQMDPDGDGLACQVSTSASVFTVIESTAVPVYIAPTPIPYVPPTAAPVYVAPTATPTIYVPPIVTPMMIAPTSTPLPYIPGLNVNGKVANPETCICDYDYYNCDSFGSREDAVACTTHCSNLGYGDIHRLDQGGAKDIICEATFDAEINFDAFDIPDVGCDCSRDAYNCSDGTFQTQAEAQSCFNYCYYDLNVGDIHGLDGNDKDLMACESLPGPQ